MEVRFENGMTGRGWVFYPRGLGWFSEFDATTTHMVPRVDVIEDTDKYHFYFEMPGLKSESIDARVEDGQLVVAAELSRPEWPQDTKVRVAERRYGKLYRVFELPSDASGDKVEASYKDGVLELALAKKAESKPAKIQIN